MSKTVKEIAIDRNTEVVRIDDGFDAIYVIWIPKRQEFQTFHRYELEDHGYKPKKIDYEVLERTVGGGEK